MNGSLLWKGRRRHKQIKKKNWQIKVERHVFSLRIHNKQTQRREKKKMGTGEYFSKDFKSNNCSMLAANIYRAAYSQSIPH